jgi:hypothetical protein
MEVANWQLVLGSNCLIRCVLVYSPPKGVELYSVLPRGGPWSKCPLARGMAPPEEFSAGSCTPNPAPLPPHARGRGGTTRGSSASQPPVVFRPYPPWVVGTGSGGEFLAPNSPLGPPPVLLADFWAAAGKARSPLDFVRWVVPIKARGRYTLCSAIHRAEGVRRAWNSHLKPVAQVAIASGRPSPERPRRPLQRQAHRRPARCKTQGVRTSSPVASAASVVAHSAQRMLADCTPKQMKNELDGKEWKGSGRVSCWMSGEAERPQSKAEWQVTSRFLKSPLQAALPREDCAGGKPKST